MTAPLLRPTLTPPPGAPREWPRMSWSARTSWLRAQARAQRAAEAAPEPEPPIEYDDRGRRIWTIRQMRAAANAHVQHSKGKRAPLTTDERDALSAYYRWRRAGKPGAGDVK